MVREAHLSSDCPSLPVDHESILDEEFSLLDEWTFQKNSKRDSPRQPQAVASVPSPRNLAGIAPAPAVSVKSRRKIPGRSVKSDAATHRRQFSVYLPLRDWRLLRDEAARQRIPMAELARQWFRPRLDQLEFEWGEEMDGS